MTPSRILTATIVASLAMLSLAACTDTDDSTPSSSASASASPSTSAVPDSVTDITDTPGAGSDGEGGGFEGALSDYAPTGCSLVDGAWIVEGTLTNSTDAAADYRVYISLLNGSGETRALQQADVDGVEPGATAEVSLSIPLDEDGLNCVPRIERYTA